MENTRLSIILFVIILIISLKYCIKYKEFFETAKFQHSKVDITVKNLKCVNNYKKILLKKIVDIFNKFDIRYFITDGNLLEIYRKSQIINDDDIDIIIHFEDFPKWEKYCLSLTKYKDNKYSNGEGLIFDKRAKDFKQQKRNGIQIFLDESKLRLNKPDKNIIVHADVIISKHNTLSNFWARWRNHDNFSEPLQKVSYMGTLVYIPSIKNTIKHLKYQYGSTFETPIFKTELKDNTFDQIKNTNIYNQWIKQIRSK